MQPERRPIVVYGACQAQVIAYLAARAQPLSERFEFIVVSDVVEPGKTPEPLPEKVATAAVVWEQLDQRPHLPMRDALHRAIPKKATRVRFPGVSMNAFWPFKARDVRNEPEPGFPWGRYPIGDSVGITVRRLGLRGSRALDRYLELSAPRVSHVRRLVELERSLYATRDAACDVKMGAYIFERLRDTYQFWTFGHLSAGVYRELLVRLLEATQTIVGTIDDDVRAAVDDVIAQYPGQGDMQLPMHPAVIEELGLTFADASTTYRWFDNKWTFEEYITRYIEMDRSW